MPNNNDDDDATIIILVIIVVIFRLSVGWLQLQPVWPVF